ncbi:MAG: CopY/TcrY family copper transport repressor, partial [Lacticaseibacillus paracasei]
QMKIGTAINHLMTNVTLSKHDIEMLQQTLLAKQHDAPETVSCNCLPEGCKEAAHE